MNKVATNVKLNVSFFKQGKRYVAYSPTLDLSTSGQTLADARKKITEAAMLFLEELYQSNNLEKVLSDLGWRKKSPSALWQPPLTSQEEIPVALSIK